MDNHQIKKLEGRLFTRNGQLCLVLSVDLEHRLARVSTAHEGKHKVTELPLPEVQAMVAAEPRVILESLRDPQRRERIEQTDLGWFFNAREGRQGPYPTREEASAELQRHVRAAAS